LSSILAISNSSDLFLIIVALFLLSSIILLLFIVLKKHAKVRPWVKATLLVIWCVSLLSVIANIILGGYNGYYLQTRTATDVLYVTNDGSHALYMRQPSNTYVINTTLYAYGNNKMKRVEFNKNIHTLSTLDGENIIFSDGNTILSYNSRTKKRENLYKTGNSITFLAINPNGKNFVCTRSNKPLGESLVPNIYRKYSYLRQSSEQDVIIELCLYDFKTKDVTILDYGKEEYGKTVSFPSISGDKIVFVADGNILLYDLSSHETRFLAHGFWPRISKGGKYVIYMNSIGNYFNIYRYNISSSNIVQISPDSNEYEQYIQQYTGLLDTFFDHDISNASTFFDISDDGNIVAYIESVVEKNNMDITIARHIYYHNFLTNETIKFNPFEGVNSRNNLQLCTLKLSGNGRYLLFTGNSLTKNETDNLIDVYIKDMETGEVKCLSTQSFTWFSPKIRLKI